MTTSRESASTPISAGGYTYHHEDPQDRADFADSTAAELAQYTADGYDMSQHPAESTIPELSPEDLACLVSALTDYEPQLRAALAGPSPGPGAAGRLVEALELAHRLRATLTEQAEEPA